MFRFPKLASKSVARALVAVLLPWLPAYLFESVTFWLGVGGGPWYGILTGYRLPVDVASFALGGILLAYLVRPRWAILQVALASVVLWVLLYQACPTFRIGGLLHSECYQTGPDGLAGLRLSLEMFSFGALPPIAKVAPQENLNPKIRPLFAVLAGFAVTSVMGWFPIAAWFSGVTYLPPLPIFQAAILVGIPLMVTGMLAARISKSIRIAMLSGPFSMLILTGTFWTLLCPGCERYWLVPLVPFWALFALLGGFMELGSSAIPRWGHLLPRRINHEDVRRVATALVITLTLWTVIANSFWDPSVLNADAISPGPGDSTIGLPTLPYVAGFYNSTQYRICCLQIGVSFVKTDPASLAPNNFLMAGMGVQSPNCCIDGWDFGWRADAFLLHDSSIVISGSTWGTCDSNVSCGGIFWQYLRYHAEVVLHPANLSSPIFLRMMWQPFPNNPTQSHVNWYYNTTGTPWQEFGSFIPDFREGTYFDIGLPAIGNGNQPERNAYFFQFGVASKSAVQGWTVLLLYPSFQYQMSWRLMERANVIQGDRSFWKGAYRWAGRPYPGVTVRAKYLDPSMNPGVAEFSYTGGTIGYHEPLW